MPSAVLSNFIIAMAHANVMLMRCCHVLGKHMIDGVQARLDVGNHDIRM